MTIKNTKKKLSELIGKIKIEGLKFVGGGEYLRMVVVEKPSSTILPTAKYTKLLCKICGISLRNYR